MCKRAHEGESEHRISGLIQTCTIWNQIAVVQFRTKRELWLVAKGTEQCLLHSRLVFVVEPQVLASFFHSMRYHNPVLFHVFFDPKEGLYGIIR